VRQWHCTLLPCSELLYSDSVGPLWDVYAYDMLEDQESLIRITQNTNTCHTHQWMIYSFCGVQIAVELQDAVSEIVTLEP
jgi:hypothetical protein